MQGNRGFTYVVLRHNTGNLGAVLNTGFDHVHWCVPSHWSDLTSKYEYSLSERLGKDLHDRTNGTTNGASNNVVADLRLLGISRGEQLSDLEDAYDNAS